MEWLGIDDVSALNARKYKMVTLGERKTENAQVDYEYCGITVRELTVNPKRDGENRLGWFCDSHCTIPFDTGFSAVFCVKRSVTFCAEAQCFEGS